MTSSRSRAGGITRLVASTKSTANLTHRTNMQPTHEEVQYLELVRDILDNGERRPDR
jgi:hypothetical protein